MKSDDLLRVAARLGRIGGWSVELRGLRLTWSDPVRALHEVADDFSCSWERAVAFFAAEHRAVLLDRFARCASEGLPFDEELRLVTARGRRLWVRVAAEALRDRKGRITRVDGAMQDIDAGKARALEHRRAADALAGTLESMPDGYAAVDAQWRLVAMNPGAARILRCDRSEVMGRSLWEAFSPILGTSFERAYRRAMDERVTVDFAEFYAPVQVWLRVRAWPTADGGLAACFVDISAQVTAEFNYRRLNEELEERVSTRTAELERANREVETLTFAIAHDVRAPLVSIGAFAQAIEWQQGDALTERSRSYLQRIQQATTRMNEMMEGLLQLGRITQTPVSTVVDLGALAREAWRTLSASDARQVQFHVHEGLRVTGVKAQLALVLQNLLSNARKFAAHVPEPAVEVGSVLGEDGETVFFVRDNGAGFDAAHASKLFSPFQRLHSAEEFPGSGLGLATVRKIIGLHGGKVWASSKPGAGAIFFFTVPRERRTSGPQKVTGWYPTVY